MKLNTRSVVGVLALASIIAAAVVMQPANIPSASAQAASSCTQIGVFFSRNQLPVGMYPAFTISGPGGITISSSRFFPGNGQELQWVNTTNSGASLPAGTYYFHVDPTVGISRLISINHTTNLSNFSILCGAGNILSVGLGYGPAAQPPSGGPYLRINPAPQTVRVGSNPVYFGAEYSTDGQNWSDVSMVASIGSTQDVGGASGLVRVAAGRPHGGNLAEVYGERPGVAQITATYAGLTAASVNITVTAGASNPPGGGRASCQMWSDPQTATGGPVRLTYTVGNLPTTITIAADDSAATPLGVPTVGAPDPARADSSQNGSINSGPVTKRTVFTMTVANSVVTSRPQTCSVTVPFAARPETNLRLPLIATLLDVHDMFYSGSSVGTQSINSVAYSNGTFAFSGECGGRKDQTYGSSQFRQGGAWFFKDDGTAIAERDICMDGGSQFQPLFFHGKARSQMVADGDRGFFMAVKSFAASSGGTGIVGAGANRAGYYQVAGGGVLFTPAPRTPGFMIREPVNFMAAGGKVVGDVEVGPDGATIENVTLSLPSLQILAERESNFVRPTMGFEDYVLGALGRPTGGCVTPTSVLGTPTVFRIEPDGGLTSVQTLSLPDNLCPGRMAIDYTTSPKRLAVASFSGSGSSRQFTDRIFLFTSGANGLEPAGELKVPASILSESNKVGSYLPAFAVGGSYMAFAGRATDGKFLTLWRDNELVGIAEPPVRRPYNPSEHGSSVATTPYWLYITPQGKIMGSNGNTAYLFGSTPGASTSTPPVPPNPFPTSTLSQIPGQTLTINTSVTPATVLARMANVISASPTSLNISILGHTYTVDASKAKIYNMNWTLIPLSSFSAGSYVNVWGTLDPANQSLIHAINIRSPLPATLNAGTSQATSFAAPAQSAASTGDTQRQLNTLQEMLRALQLRLAR